MIKNLPAMWETQVQSLGWEDPLAYSSILTWEISEEPGGYSHGVTKSRTRLSFGGLFIYLFGSIAQDAGSSPPTKH